LLVLANVAMARQLDPSRGAEIEHLTNPKTFV
jgi:hypothetical protein